MGRLRVPSFMLPNRDGQSKNNGTSFPRPSSSSAASRLFSRPTKDPESSVLQQSATLARDSPVPASRQSLYSNARPVSMLPQQQSPLVDVNPETVPELEPILSFLSSQSNKLYHEGVFLKLNDLDIHGRPAADRQWQECFAQLVGTVLSLWDAAALHAAGADGEVAPTFINIADASIKMIETLPTRNQERKPLHNVLSISTAGKNRYLLHFDSLHSLSQWTAGIRLAMFENTVLQESYTGALIAGKGKMLNNIRTILDRSRFKQEDWARVRFGPGTPWTRCWCVISPPDEKELQRLQKVQKKKSVYDRSTVLLKGDIKFYETKKTKKAKPIATITDAFSAYAIYPQSRPLIEQSTLVKVEGQVTIHSQTQSTAEGFVFVLPETHPAVSGFEIMLRWLIPVFDTFGLYGRPIRLLADTTNPRSLMFALPKNKRSGYLDILDVTSLIHTEGSQNWTEREWRKRMKDATSRRMMTNTSSRDSSTRGSRRLQRSSFPSPNRTSMRFGDNPAVSLASKLEHNYSTEAVFSSSTGTSARSSVGLFPLIAHARAASENTKIGYEGRQGQSTPPSRYSFEHELPDEGAEHPPPPPPHGTLQYNPGRENGDNDQRSSSDSDSKLRSSLKAQEIERDIRSNPFPGPVATPPAFLHNPRELPQTRPPSSDLRQAGNRMSSGTLSQLLNANRIGEMAVAGATAAWNGNRRGQLVDQGQRQGVGGDDNQYKILADRNIPSERPIAADASKTSVSDSPIPTPEVTSPNLNLSTVPASTSREYGPPRLTPINTQKAVTRKPLPQELSPTTPSSLGSLRDVIDIDALDRVIARDPSPPPPVLQRQIIVRQYEESIDDKSSTLSPDYASSRKSSVSKRSSASAPRPRMGVLKMVGTPEPTMEEVVIGDSHYQNAISLLPENPDIPLVDFGPTQAYVPTAGRPGTSDTMTLLAGNTTPDGATAQNDKKSSPGTTLSGRKGENGHSRSPTSEDHRTGMVWQPGMASGGRSSPGPRITVEQFVQQRVDANRITTPAYTHQRGISGTILPPRPASGDWTAYTRQQSMVRDMPPRPHSRGASIMLGHNDVSTQLSAREQEHVARVTGSSFFNFTSDNNKQPPPLLGSSLVGAIDARQREKQAMKDGVSGQAVQQAIAQRQYQAQFQPQPQGQVYSNPSQQLYMNQQRSGGVGENSAWSPLPYQQQQYWPPGPQPWQQQIPTPTGYRPNQYSQPFANS